MFRTRKLVKIFNSQAALQKAFGARRALEIMRRMAVLRAASCLGRVPKTPPDRCHQLVGDRNLQFAVDLVHPFRLVLEPANEPVPRMKDGGADLEEIDTIRILRIEDYH